MARALKPIPKAVLSDNMQVYTPKTGGYGGEYSEPVTVSNVRLETGTELNAGAGRISDAKARVFIDARNSANAFDIPAGSAVEIRGKRYKVISCDRYDGFAGKPHHWEVQLA